jgi:hypothetical protein
MRKPSETHYARRLFAVVLPALVVGVMIGRMWGISQARLKARQAQEESQRYRDKADFLEAELAKARATAEAKP